MSLAEIADAAYETLLEQELELFTKLASAPGLVRPLALQRLGNKLSARYRTGWGAALAWPGSTLGATASSAWDGTTGNSCPGALHLAALFKGYASGTAKDEVINVDLRLPGANWTGAVALHAWVKVAPVAGPLRGVQLFVVSGASFLYASVFEDKAFDGGSWYEMVLPLEAGATFDPSSVRRIGLQLLLERFVEWVRANGALT